MITMSINERVEQWNQRIFIENSVEVTQHEISSFVPVEPLLVIFTVIRPWGVKSSYRVDLVGRLWLEYLRGNVKLLPGTNHQNHKSSEPLKWVNLVTTNLLLARILNAIDKVGHQQLSRWRKNRTLLEIWLWKIGLLSLENVRWVLDSMRRVCPNSFPQEAVQNPTYACVGFIY